MQESTRIPSLHQDASKSALFMLLAVETVAAEEVDNLVADSEAEDVEEEVYKV